jgi:hypothetical protein
MAQYLFGAGKIFATPLQDVHGNPITNGTPVEVGVLQSTSVDISYDLKELYGRGQFAVDAARGKGSIKCKATMGRINGALLNSIFFGGVLHRADLAHPYPSCRTVLMTIQLFEHPWQSIESLLPIHPACQTFSELQKRC